MFSRCVRSLMLVCGLTLALPPGWCCLLASQTTATTAPRPGTCCCTCPASGAKEQPPGSEPPKSPTAPLPKHCPCTDRQTVLTAGVTPEQADGGVIPLAIFPVLDIRPALAGIVGRVDSDAHPPPLRLHVLHCQWLC